MRMDKLVGSGHDLRCFVAKFTVKNLNKEFIKIKIRKMASYGLFYKSKWKLGIVSCGSLVRKICVRKKEEKNMCKEKQSRLLFPEKAANSFLGRPSEDRTGAGAGRASTDFGQNCQTHLFNSPPWNAGL